VEDAPELERDLRRAIAVGRAVHADEEEPLVQRRLRARDQEILLDLLHHARGHAAELRLRLTAEPECAHRHEVVVPGVGLANDLLVVDPLDQLPGHRQAGGRALLLHLVEVRVADELESLLDQLVMHLALPFDLFGRLELGGKTGLELAEADVVEPGGVHVVAGEVAAGARAELDGAVDRPVGVLGIVDGNEHFTIHAAPRPIGRSDDRVRERLYPVYERR
jgi:hypothetical protein